jgi:hypothetical protein
MEAVLVVELLQRELQTQAVEAVEQAQAQAVMEALGLSSFATQAHLLMLQA